MSLSLAAFHLTFLLCKRRRCLLHLRSLLLYHVNKDKQEACDYVVSCGAQGGGRPGIPYTGMVGRLASEVLEFFFD
jgi:hypothetical protein